MPFGSVLSGLKFDRMWYVAMADLSGGYQKNRLLEGDVEFIFLLRIRTHRKKSVRMTYHLSVRFVLDGGKSQTGVCWMWATSGLAAITWGVAIYKVL